MQKLKITVPEVGVFEIDPADFEIQWPDETPGHGRIIGIKNPLNYPKLVNLLAGNQSLWSLKFIAFYI